MDVETSEAIDNLGVQINALGRSLRGEISGLGNELRGEISGLGNELRGEISGLRNELRGEISELRNELRGEMASVREQLREEFREGLAGNRRHTEVLFESLRDDIRMVADGVATLAAKLDSQAR